MGVVGDGVRLGAQGEVEDSNESTMLGHLTEDSLYPKKCCSLSSFKGSEGQNLSKYNTDTQGRSPKTCE